MFNFILALFSDGFQSSGTIGNAGGIKTEAILLLIMVFIAGMFTQYAFTKIKEYIKERKKNNKEDE